MLTVADVQAKSLNERVNALTTDQLQALLDACVTILESRGLNAATTNYTTIFDRVELLLFDWMLSNPSYLKSLTQGQLTEVYSLEIPSVILTALRPILKGGVGVLSREGGV